MSNDGADKNAYDGHYKNLYNEDAEHYDHSRFGKRSLRYAKQVKNALILDVLAKKNLLSERTKIIDVATGTGRIAHELAKQQFSEVFATDIALEMLRRNKDHLMPRYQKKMSWTNANMKSLPFPANSFDVATVGSFFYLIPLDEYHNFTTDIHRVLKPDGLLICEVSNALGLFNPANVARIFVHKYWKRMKVKSYAHPWNVSRLFKGFVVDEMIGVEYPMVCRHYGIHQRLAFVLGRSPITRFLGGKFLLVLRKRQMFKLTEVLEKHSLKLCSVLQETNRTSVCLVTDNEGTKQVLKVNHNWSTGRRYTNVERQFLTHVDHHGLTYLNVPRVFGYGDNYVLMEYVEREHLTRDTIKERLWSNDDIQVWVRGLLEFQDLQISREWFSPRRRVMGFLFPVIRLFLLLPKAFHVIGRRALHKVVWLAFTYSLARFHFRNKTTHYDLQTYNYSFQKDKRKASLVDFELSYYMGDPLYDVLHYVSIPVQKITLWTFQSRLVGAYLAESRESCRYASCRARLILLVCNINRYLRFKDDAAKQDIYRDNIRMLLSAEAFNSWFSRLTTMGGLR